MSVRTGSGRGPAERVYSAIGVALACGAIAFAYVEVRDNDGTPKVFGGTYLALFSQPSRHAPARREGDEREATPQPAPDPRGTIDFSATATIPVRQGWDVFVDGGETGGKVRRRARSANDPTPTGRDPRSAATAPGQRTPAGAVVRSIVRRDGTRVVVVDGDESDYNSR